MKYLVAQPTTTQQLFQQHYATFNQHLIDLGDIKQLQSQLNKVDLIESQLNQLTIDQKSLQQLIQDQSHSFEQKFISIESNNNSQKQLQPCLTTIEQQRIQVSIILEQNRKLMKDKRSSFVIIQIENCPDIQTSCDSWGIDISINALVYDTLIPCIHPTKLEPLKETIESSKLYISSKSVLNGEWVQIQGDGAIVDMKNKILLLGDFLKPGDDIYQYDDYQCKKCEHHFVNDDDDDTTTNCYLIKFKWD